MSNTYLDGDRHEISRDNCSYPAAFKIANNPPEKLYVLGNPDVLSLPGVAIIGNRRATPYGRDCANLFAGITADENFVVISGGSLGIGAEAHKTAIERNAPTIAVLAGGANIVYPQDHKSLFEEIIENGGALVSEQPWDTPPLPHMFRARNRIITGLAKATLLVEASVPSGMFSCADEELAKRHEVWAVPGNICSPNAKGANALIASGAHPIIDAASYINALDLIR